MTWLSKTSIAIRRKIARITAHYSPYHHGLAPETHDFVAALNSEAQRTGREISFTVQANRIMANGDIEAAETAAIAKAEGERMEFLQKVYVSTRRLHELVKAIPKRDLAGMSINPRDFDPAVSVVHHKPLGSALGAGPHRFGRGSGRRRGTKG